jgi:hypothetical protein
MPNLLAVIVIGWVVSGVVGAVIGSRRNSSAIGFALGLLFGPLGAIAAFALDGRFPCPRCGNKIDNDVRLCPTCRGEVAWFDGRVGSPETVDSWRAESRRRREDRVAAEKRLQDQREKQAAAFRRRISGALGVVSGILASLCRGVLRVFVSVFAALDGGIRDMADGSKAAYRGLWVGCFVLMPITLLTGIGVVIWVSRSAPYPSVAKPDQDAEARPLAAEVPAVREVRPVAAEMPAVIEAAPPPEKERVAIVDIPVQAPLKPEPNAAAEEMPEMAAGRPVALPAIPEAAKPPEPRVAADVGPEPRQAADALPADAEHKPAVGAPRPVAVDGGEINRLEIEAQEREDRKQRIRSLESEVKQLARARVKLQQEARQAAARASAGIQIFGGSPPSYYLEQADELVSKMRGLRSEIDQLKRQDAQRPAQ